MSKKFELLLYLNDRDIYDGLTSSKKQITEKMLNEFFLERGIFLSGALNRQNLINYISMLNLDHHDIQFLIEQLTPSSRKEKVRFIDLDCEASKSELRDIINSVKSERTDDYDESYQSKLTGDDNSVVVNVEYKEIDLSKTRLRQRKHKESEIELESIDNNKVRIRFPDNSRSEEIAASIQKKLKESKNISSDVKSIDLSNVISPRYRTEFFIKIISNLSDMELYDVTKVKVDSRLAGEQEANDDEEADEETIKGFVKNAVLNGSSILSSDIYQELQEKNFYICELGWEMTEKITGGDKLTFIALFSDAPQCSIFSCSVLGKNTYKKDGFTVTRKKLDAEENKRYFSLLECAASKAYEDVITSYNQEIDEEATGNDESN